MMIALKVKFLVDAKFLRFFYTQGFVGTEKLNVCEKLRKLLMG